MEREAWVRHFNTSYYTGDWEVVSLRSTSAKVSEIYPDPTKNEYLDTELLIGSSVFQTALSAFQCPLLSARLMRLAPNSTIREHRDHCLSFEDGEIRVHIPVRTNPLVEFYLDGERIVMEEGEAWYLDLNKNHAVINRSSEDRVHLVVDCVVNNWLRRIAGVSNGGLEEFRDLVFREPELMLRLQAEEDGFSIPETGGDTGGRTRVSTCLRKRRSKPFAAGRQVWHSRRI